MVLSMEVVAGVLVAVLLVFTTYAMAAGIEGALFGERFARCTRCGRLGMTLGGQRHPRECPPSLLDRATRLVHGVHLSFHNPHLRHH
jgi:hypothetical protein